MSNEPEATLYFKYPPEPEQLTVRRLDDAKSYWRVGMIINVCYYGITVKAQILDVWLGQFRALPGRLIELEAPPYRTYSKLLRGLREYYPNDGFAEETMVVAIHFLILPKEV